MSARLRSIAAETERIVAAGGYRAPDGREVSLAAWIEAARAGTRMFGPDPVPLRQTGGTGTGVPAAASAAGTVFEVTGESSLEAAAGCPARRSPC